MIWNEIVCLGDSITYGSRDEFGRSYPLELNNILKERTGEFYICHNYGAPAETSSDLLRRTWQAFKSHPEARISLILVGTNDTQSNIPPEIYEDNLKQIVNMSRICKARPIVATLPDLGFTPLYLNNPRNIKLYNKKINTLSSKLNFEVCKMEGIEKHYIDNVHFSHKGNLEIAKRWADTILNING